MSARLRVDRAVVEKFLDAWSHPTAPWQRELDALIAELRWARTKFPKPKRKPRKPPTPLSAADARAWTRIASQAGIRTKAQKRAETADLWNQAMVRSGGFCECECGRAFADEGDNKPELDHEASRRVPQTITNVWMLARVCHHQRQANKPSEDYWLRNFLRHCQKHNYAKEARRVENRIAVVEVKSNLPASPNLRSNRALDHQ